MISKATLAHFGETVEHMREVHERAVLLNVAVYANWEQLRKEKQDVLSKRYRMTSVLNIRSNILAYKVRDYFKALGNCTWEPGAEYLIERMEEFMQEMDIIEDCLLEFSLPVSLREVLEYCIHEYFSEDMRTALEDWITKLNYQENEI